MDCQTEPLQCCVITLLAGYRFGGSLGRGTPFRFASLLWCWLTFTLWTFASSVLPKMLKGILNISKPQTVRYRRSFRQRVQMSYKPAGFAQALCQVREGIDTAMPLCPFLSFPFLLSADLMTNAAAFTRFVLVGQTD